MSTVPAKRKLPILTIALVLACMVVSLHTPACADDSPLTPREKQLLDMVEALEKRVSELEKICAGPQAPADIVQRVDQIEAKIEKKEAASPNDFRAYWKDGLNFTSNSKQFKLKIGGRIQNDWAWFNDGNTLEKVFGDNEDATEFRRARLYMSGTLYDNFTFKAQYDFAANGDSEFKDVWLAMKDIPYVGTVKIGHFKEPLSLEALTSSNHNGFMERALAVDAFAPGRNTGIQVSNNAFNSRLTWAVGWFRNANDEGESFDDGGYNVTARATGLPWYKDAGRRLLHLGIAYSHRNIDDDVRFRSRPEAHLAQYRYLDTGTIRADDMDLWNAELALVYGPFSLQGEYFQADVDTVLAGDHDFDGWYASVSYFLTGEHRPYKKGAGTFDRVRPENNFDLAEGGWGAWEVLVRYSTLDLDDGWIIAGGEEQNTTLGINWYLNPSLRVMLNYVHAEIDHVLYNDDLDIIQTRFQLTF